MGSKNARGLNPETIDMLKNNTLNQYDLNRLIVNNMHMGFHPNAANRFMAPPVNTTAGPNMPYPPKPPRQSGEQNIIMTGSLAGSRMSLMGHSHDIASKNHMNYQTHMKYESTGSLSQMYENTSTSKSSNTYVSKKEPPVSSSQSTQPSKSTLLQELLECPICMNLYDNPHVLPCQHTFCKKCIVSLQNTNTNNGNNATIDCPICREKHTLVNGVESLTANYTMKRLIELDAIQVASEKEKEKLITASVLKETSSSERDRQLPKEVVKPIKAKCFSCQKFAYLGVCPHCSYTLCFECTQNPDHDIIIESKINAKKYLYPHKQVRSSFRMPRHESTCYRPATEYSIRRDVYMNVSKMNHGGNQNINSSSNHPPMSPTIREHSPQEKYEDSRLSMPHQHQNSQQSQGTNLSQHQQQQQKLKLILLCHSSAVECSLEDDNNTDRNSDKDEIYQDEYGKCSTFSKVNISPMDRVVTLKKLIESRFGIACDDQILVYKDKILNNDFKVLSHYKLRQFSRIHIFDERDIKESDGNEDDSLFGVYQQSNFNQNNSERKSSSKQAKNRSLKIEEIGEIEEKTTSSHSDSFSGSASFQTEEANNSEQKQQQQRSRMSSRFVNSSKSTVGQKQPIQRVLSQQPPLADTRRSPAFNYAATGGSTMSRSVNYYSTKRYRKLDEIFDRQLSLNTSSTLNNY